MPYHPLAVPPGTNPNLERMVREQIDPLLRDVHAMLRLPMDGAPGLEGGCTFPAALTLLKREKIIISAGRDGYHLPGGIYPQADSLLHSLKDK